MDCRGVFNGENIMFNSVDGQRLCIRDFTEGDAKIFSNSILRLLSLIPRIEKWTIEELLSSSDSKRFYSYKWNLSALIFHEDHSEPIGIIIAYFRTSDIEHPFDSVYIQRFAISREFQDKKIGSNALYIYLNNVFNAIPWLQNVTVQTNDTVDNYWVIAFYEKIGFIKFQHVYYLHKVDWLLRLKRPDMIDYSKLSTNKFETPLIRHPYRYTTVKSPFLYISTSSDLKFYQFDYLFNCYNVQLSRIPAPTELTEPQVEESNHVAEVKLVIHPLKQAARFLANNNTLPFIVEDTMLFIEFFNSKFDSEPELPGHDTKRWWRQFGEEGILQLMGQSHRRRAIYVSQIGAYLGGDKYISSRGEIEGVISDTPRRSKLAHDMFPKTNPWFFHSIFVPNGSNHTLAEMNPEEFIKYDYRRKSVEGLLSQLEPKDRLQLEFDFFL